MGGGPGVFHAGSPGLAAGGDAAAVTPPSPTSEAVASGGTPSAKTFGAFTDPDGAIASYSSVITNATGSTARSGSNLGAYTFSGHGDGSSFTLSLHALDASGNKLATATHSVDVAVDAVDIGNITLTTIDLTSGWTLYDPDSLVASVSYSGGFNTIVMNALGSGSANYVWKNSGAKRGPRWYRNFQDSGMTPANQNRGDLLVGIYKLDFDDTVRDFKADVICGTARTANSLTASGVALGGAIGSLSSASAGSNAAYGCFCYSAATVAATSGPDQGVITFLHGAERVGGGAYTLLDSNDLALNTGVRNSNQAVTSNGSPMSQVVAVGTYNNSATISANDEVKIRIQFAYIKPSLT